jgi:hypothetical protein
MVHRGVLEALDVCRGNVVQRTVLEPLSCPLHELLNGLILRLGILPLLFVCSVQTRRRILSRRLTVFRNNGELSHTRLRVGTLELEAF